MFVEYPATMVAVAIIYGSMLAVLGLIMFLEWLFPKNDSD